MSKEKENKNTFKNLVDAVLESPEKSSQAKLMHCLFHYQGYRGRVLNEQCPYPSDTKQFYSWQLGWQLADAELKK